MIWPKTWTQPSLTIFFWTPASMMKLTDSAGHHMSSPCGADRKTLLDVLASGSSVRTGSNPRWAEFRTTGTMGPSSAPSRVPSFWRMRRAQSTSWGTSNKYWRLNHTHTRYEEFSLRSKVMNPNESPYTCSISAPL